MASVSLAEKAFINHAKYYYHKFGELDKQYQAGGDALSLSLKAFDSDRAQYESAQKWLASHVNLGGDVSVMCVDYSIIASDLLLLRLSPKEYLDWLKTSFDALKYIPQKPPLTEAKLYELRGRSYMNIGQYDEAMNYHQRALKIAKAHGFADLISSAQHGIDMIDLRQGRLSSVLEAKESANQSLSSQAADLFNKGSALMLKKRNREALEAFNQALEYARQLQDYNNVAATLLMLANVYGDMNEFDKGMACATEARTLSREFGLEESMGTSLGIIGALHFTQKRYDEALANFQPALEITLKRNDQQGIANLYQNIGNVYLMTRDHARALEYFQQARVIYVELGADFLVQTVDSLIAQCTIRDTPIYKILSLNPLNPVMQPIINKLLGGVFYWTKKTWMDWREQSRFK